MRNIKRLENKIGICVYCGDEREITKDHVISKGLFPENHKKKNPIIVPSCLKCNNSFSLDEEHFRLLFCGSSVGQSLCANDLFFTKIKRSIQRRPQIAHKALEQMELVELYTKSGIYLGERTKIHIPDNDWKRYRNVLDKYIKGLFFYEFKTILSSKDKIKHFWGEDALQLVKKINKRDLKWNLDNKEVFAYSYTLVAHSFKSIWLTVFYDDVFFVSLVATGVHF